MILVAFPEFLGLDVARLTAGFAGGVVHTFIFRQTEAYTAVGSVLTGTLTANYLGPAVGQYLSGFLGEGGAAFVVGLTAMAICQGIIAVARLKFGLPSKAEEEKKP